MADRCAAEKQKKTKKPSANSPWETKILGKATESERHSSFSAFSFA